MKKIYLTIGTLLTGLILLAQEKSTDINADKESITNNWYSSPLVWVCGAALFIILLIVLSTGSRRSSGN